MTLRDLGAVLVIGLGMGVLAITFIYGVRFALGVVTRHWDDDQ